MGSPSPPFDSDTWYSRVLHESCPRLFCDELGGVSNAVGSLDGLVQGHRSFKGDGPLVSGYDKGVRERQIDLRRLTGSELLFLLTSYARIWQISLVIGSRFRSRLHPDTRLYQGQRPVPPHTSAC